MRLLRVLVRAACGAVAAAALLAAGPVSCSGAGGGGRDAIEDRADHADAPVDVRPDIADLVDAVEGDSRTEDGGEGEGVSCDPDAEPLPAPAVGKQDRLYYSEMPRCVPAGRNLSVFARSKNLYEPPRLEPGGAEDRELLYVGYRTIFAGLEYGWILFDVRPGVIEAMLYGDGDSEPSAVLAIPVVEAAGGDPLLENPGFEAGTWEGEHGSRIPDGWLPWYYHGTPEEIDDFQYYEPNFDVETSAAPDYSRRVRTGAQSFRLFTSYATHRGGLLQHVDVGGREGCTAVLSAWVNTWSHDPEDGPLDCAPGNYRAAVGIDPAGGDDGESGSVVWGETLWDAHTCPFWAGAEASAVITGSSLTVLLRGWPQYPVAENPSYWDDMRLAVVCE